MTAQADSVVGLSIVIAAYNSAETLLAAAESVFRQHRMDFELIIVDDGSSDSTLDVARGIGRDNRHVTVLTQPNAGTAAAVNAGLRAASGEFIARLDADDQLADDYLVTMAAFISKHPGFDIYGIDLLSITPGEPDAPVFGWGDVRSTTLAEMLVRDVIPGAGTIARRDLLITLGGYREGILNEDYDLWLRALASGATHIHCPKALYRYTQGSAAQKTGDLIAQHESSIEIIEHLVATVSLSETDAEAAKTGIEQRRSILDDIRNWGGSTGYRLRDRWAKQDAASYERFLRRFLSDSSADRAFRLTHKVAWIVRPLRQAIWRMRIRSEK